MKKIFLAARLGFYFHYIHSFSIGRSPKAQTLSQIVVEDN